MSCRTTPAGSAWTTFSRLESGLTDVQTLSTFHALRREGRGIPAPSEQEWADFVANQRAEMNNAGFSTARMRSLNGRMDRAAEERPDGASWHALRNIRERARTESTNVENQLRGFAEISGETFETVNARYQTYLNEVDRGRTVTAPEGYDAARERWRRQGLPADHGTYTALTRISAETMQTAAAEEERPRRVTPVMFPNSSAIHSAGYDPADGRLEVTFRRRGSDGEQNGTSRTYGYRDVPPEIWAEMCGEAGPGIVYNREVRNHDQYRYESRAEEDAAAHRRCANCGQWMGDGHTCPVPAAGEPVSTAVPVGRQRTRAEHAAVGAEINQYLAENPSTPEGGPFDHDSGRCGECDGHYTHTDDCPTLRPAPATNVISQTPDGRARIVSAIPTATDTDDDESAFLRCPDCGEFMDGSHVCTASSTDAPDYAERVRAWEDKGLSTSDAQSTVDAEDMLTQNAITELRARLTGDSDTEVLAAEDRSRNADLADQEAEARFAAEDAATAAAAEAPVEPEVPARPEPVSLRSLGIYPRRRSINRRRAYGDPAYHDRANVPTATEVRPHAATAPVLIPVSYSGWRRFTGQALSTDGLPAGSFNVSGAVVYDRPARGQHIVEGRDLACDCPEYAENYRCPHINVVLERYRQHLIPANSSAAASQPVDPAAAQAAAEASLRTDWMRNEQHAEEARARHAAVSSPEDSYTNNFEAFETDHDAALARKAAGQEAVPYMNENATNGVFTRESGRGFGVEMEFDFPNTMDYTAKRQALQRIGVELHELGLTPTSYQEGYHSSARRGYTDNHQGGWSFEQDCTVSGEVVSPVMYDEPETWENIEKVCEVIRRNGGTANAKTGSHVHVGAPNMTTQTASEMVRMTNQHEDIMYRISQNPEKNAHRPMSWCGPNNEVPQGGYDNVSSLRYVGSGHRNGMNLAGVRGGDSDHPEVRYWDGTLNPAVIQAQVKISGAIVTAAERNGALGNSQRGRETVGAHHTRLQAVRGRSRRALTSDELKEDTATMRSFVDTLFTRREDKAQVAALFAVTKWQKRR